MPHTAVVWFRRDLRVHDHPALASAVERADQVLPVYVLDPVLLAGPTASANRRWFLRESLVVLQRLLEERGAALRILHGRPEEVLPAFALEARATEVVFTRDVTPFARRRDRTVAAALAAHSIEARATAGQFVHEPDAIATGAGGPYRVFGPYHRAWAAMPRRVPLAPPGRIPGAPGARSDDIPDLGPPSADRSQLPEPGAEAAERRLQTWLADGIRDYHEHRNRLDVDGTSRLSQDFRFGLVSPQEAAEWADGHGSGRAAWIRQLAWRDFHAHVLWHHPGVTREPFRPGARAIAWRDDPEAFSAWCAGRTGYPVVDAAMRQLLASGFIPNRARLVAASFLAKDLLLDPRLGEAHFLRHLLDGDPASNTGNWQWTAGTGTDPQPFVRVFNPSLQGRRFDPQGDYVRSWVPELRGVDGPDVHEPWLLEGTAADAYPPRIVDHAQARARALAAFAAAGEGGSSGERADSGEGAGSA